MKTKTPQHKFPAIIGLIITTLLLPIIAMNVTIIVKSWLNPDKVPDFFGVKPFVVITDSMSPAFDGGDLAVVKTVDPASLQTGDIISYKEGASVVTHRIIERTEKDGLAAFVTKGDANDSEDTKAVAHSQVEGVYLFRVPKIGRLALFMQTPMGMLLFICLPVCGFALYDAARHRRLAEKAARPGKKTMV